MKKSKIKIGILAIFIIIILIQTISIAAYTTAVIEDQKKSDEIKENIEQEEIILTQEEQETLELINEYRNKHGLRNLKPISKLQAVAQIKAEDLENNHYFSHNSNNLGTPFEMLKNNGVNYKIAGENLAGNTTPKKAVEAWINSKSHRENILEDEFEYTGIYVIESETYGKIFVEIFIGI